MDKSFISRLMRGEKVNPSAETLEALGLRSVPLYEVLGPNARVRAVAQAAAEAALAQQAQQPARAPTVKAAYEMGTKGGLASDAERLAFEAWMRGHCWALCARCSGTQYLSDYEQDGNIDPHAMRTRQLWAAWRDRAALAK